jgi:TonB family protein
LNKEVYQVNRTDAQIKNGSYRNYFNGKLITEGQYTRNQRTALWTFYDAKSNLTFNGTYKEGIKHGKWTYYLKERLTSEIFYSNGRADSVNGYHNNGAISYKLRYAADRSGFCSSYYTSGQVMELIPIKNSKMEGACKFYFENEQLHREILYSEGKEQSLVSSFDTEGKPIDGGTLQDGNGTLLIYHLPEKLGPFPLVIQSRSTYSKGLRDGAYKAYNKKGQLILEGSYKDDRKIGNWKIYTDEGIFKAQVNYDNDTYNEVQSAESNYYYSCNEADVMSTTPEFQGGEEERVNFIKLNTVYPKNARMNKVEGTVYASFVISQTGEIESYEIIKSVNTELDQEVIRIVKLMPRWNPGFHNGIPVRVAFNMSIKFRVQ